MIKNRITRKEEHNFQANEIGAFRNRISIFSKMFATKLRDIKVVRSKKSKIFILPNMIELFETNQMSHFPPFYDDFFL